MEILIALSSMVVLLGRAVRCFELAKLERSHSPSALFPAYVDEHKRVQLVLMALCANTATVLMFSPISAS